MKLFPIVFAALCLTGLGAHAAVVIATDKQEGLGGITTFTPTYLVSSTDLLHTHLANVESVGDFQGPGTSGGLGQLIDGDFGTIGTTTAPAPGQPSATHPEFAVAGGGNPTTSPATGGAGKELIYYFDTVASPEGFNLSSVVVYGGWNDAGRNQQLYNLSYSVVGAEETFISLGTVNFNPGSAGQSATRVTFTEDSLEWLAENVAAVKFDFNAVPGVNGFTQYTENGYTGYAEIDVFGTAVPEPGTALLLLGGLGVCGMFGRRRK